MMDKSLGRRLAKALNEYAPEKIRGDKKALERALKERLPKSERAGVSYPAILGYFAGRTAPSMEWIRHAAAVLGVREVWLTYGVGAPTELSEREAEQAVGEAVGDAETALIERRRLVRLKIAVLRGMGVLPSRVVLEGAPEGEGEMSPDETTQAMDAWAQRVNFAWIAPWAHALMDVQRRYGRKTINAEELGQALRAPLVEVGMDPAAGMDSTYRTLDWLDDYIIAMVPVLLALAPERTRQRSKPQPKEE